MSFGRVTTDLRLAAALSGMLRKPGTRVLVSTETGDREMVLVARVASVVSRGWRYVLVSPETWNAARCRAIRPSSLVRSACAWRPSDIREVLS